MVPAVTAADLVAGARALIEPLTGHTPGPWQRDCWDVLGNGGGTGHVCEVSTPNGDDDHYWTSGEADANTRLIAAAPVMRDTIAALLDDRDALTQRIEALEAALRFYIDPDNWLIGGPLDGNSPNYTGGPARAALLVEVAQ